MPFVPILTTTRWWGLRTACGRHRTSYSAGLRSRAIPGPVSVAGIDRASTNLSPPFWVASRPPLSFAWPTPGVAATRVASRLGNGASAACEEWLRKVPFHLRTGHHDQPGFHPDE